MFLMKNLQRSMFLVNPSNKTPKYWKYFHAVSTYRDGHERPNNHKEGLFYACCNICGNTVAITNKGSTKRTTSGLRSHLSSHYVVLKSTETPKKGTLNHFFDVSKDPRFHGNERKKMCGYKV